MDKRGDGFEIARKSIYWMIAGVVITVIVLLFAMILSSYQGNLVQIPQELRAEIISLRFMNTPECFTYQDPLTNRTFPGVIDINKFTKERLDQCYRTEKVQGFKDYNFGLRLEGYPIDEDPEKLLETNNFFNKVDFTLTKNVLVRSGTGVTPTKMIIYVQRKI
jgi:hypothetical protein